MRELAWARGRLGSGLGRWGGLRGVSVMLYMLRILGVEGLDSGESVCGEKGEVQRYEYSEL